MHWANHRSINNQMRNMDFTFNPCMLTDHQRTGLISRSLDIPFDLAINPQAASKCNVSSHFCSGANQTINPALGLWFLGREHGDSFFLYKLTKKIW